MPAVECVSRLYVLQDSCAADTEPAVLEGGKQFGLSRNSHIAVAFDDTKVKNRYVGYSAMSFGGVRSKENALPAILKSTSQNSGLESGKITSHG